MELATAALSATLAAALAFAAARKVSHHPSVVAEYARVGVPEERLNALAAILLAGAGGLLAGLAWAPIGIAAAAALVVYFLLAISAHFRFDDLANVAIPIALELAAITGVALQIATL